MYTVKAFSNSLLVTWSPPKDKSIIVREYTLAWGKGVPDVYIEKISSKTREYVIKNLGKLYSFFKIIFLNSCV